MGAKILRIFEFINDVHIAIGSGVLGIFMFMRKGIDTYIVRTLSIASLTVGSLLYSFQSYEILEATPEKVIFITGCDSGLGFSLAQHSCELGFTVVAGCLSFNSEGAKELKRLFGDSIKLIELDITQPASVANAVISLEDYFAKNRTSGLWALVNNAGIMVFGEFEWLTENLIRQQLDVNISGTMRITNAFLPMLRRYSGRIVTITSHCAQATLPGLAVYGATKAALAAWSDGLRVELNKFGVHVVTFVPGSFVQQSNIMSKQNQNVFEMQSCMSQEQLNVYGDYFRQYNSYLSALSGARAPKKINDSKLYEIYEQAMLDKYPSAKYVHESWYYTIYHSLFKISPVRIRDYLILRFVQMPKWERDVRSISEAIS